MYIALLIISFIAGTVLLYFYINGKWPGCVLGAMFLAYGLDSIIILASHQTKKEDLAKYEKAKTEYEIIKNKCVDISAEMLIDYIDDIEKANDLIEKSKKWHNNWYLKDFYYKEIGELPLLELKELI